MKLRFGITIAAMRLCTIAITAVLAGVAVCGAFAQNESADATTSGVALRTSGLRESKRVSHSLTADDRLSLLAAALDARVQRDSEPDCSHLVHTIYEAAGLPYAYAPSSQLYAGVQNFQRVKTPLPGDLVVWRGHVGIVIKPSRHLFFSFLNSGPGTDDYQAAYWKHRGRPRFYRYVKEEWRR